MDKDSIILLQKLDCNCNDCIFLQRNIEKYKTSLEAHHKWQFDYFCTIRQKIIERAKHHKNKYYDLETWDRLLTEAENLKFQFNRSECLINFGYCTKLLKDVTFVPNTCQVETQECFKHRKDE